MTRDAFDAMLGAPWNALPAAAAAAAAAAWIAQWLLFAVLRRVARARATAADLVDAMRRPAAWGMPLLAVHGVARAREADLVTGALAHAAALGAVAAAVWLAVRLVGVLEARALRRHPIDVADNLDARRVHTQVHVLARTANVAIIVVGVAVALMTLPGARHLGASLLASAGLAGLAVGLAAKPVLGNLIAGLQIALTQPIRLDDVVILEGEWGRVEEITGTYVVVRIWDQRRLIVPLAYFIERPFENWTRRDTALLGAVTIWADYGVDVDAVRAELARVCEASPGWDRRVCKVDVVDATDRAIALRALVSAANADAAWSLRCLVRERLVRFVQATQPDALPRVRGIAPAEVAGFRLAPE